MNFILLRCNARMALILPFWGKNCETQIHIPLTAVHYAHAGKYKYWLSFTQMGKIWIWRENSMHCPTIRYANQLLPKLSKASSKVYFLSFLNTTCDCCEIKLSSFKYKKKLILCCPLGSCYFLGYKSTASKLNATKLLIIFSSAQLLQMCSLQLIFFPSPASRRKEKGNNYIKIHPNSSSLWSNTVPLLPQKKMKMFGISLYSQIFLTNQI